MSEKMIEYIEEAPGLIRIKPSIEGLLTTDRYIQIARDLLKHGFPEDTNQNLRDENSADLTDNMLLGQEFKEESDSAVKTQVILTNLQINKKILNHES